MWFVDHAKITVIAGDGGRGCAAFAQPPYTRSPYPDGGDGGDGGNVIVRADHNFATLLDFHFRHEFKASRGQHGGGNRKTGARGQDDVIRVPLGTVIRETDTDTILRDLTRPGEQIIVATGGRGGLGNAAASEAMLGGSGERRRLILELKLIADVGIIGFPNAGKSSLLARISTAKPKIANYPFTTKFPVLGVVGVAGGEPFVACDIPGLIEGAHDGRGLGTQFLRHIERTRLLLHLVDLAGVDGRDPFDAVRRLNDELYAYSPALQQRPQLIVVNKMDLPQAQENLTSFRAAIRQPVTAVSCATGEGIPDLLKAVQQQLSDLPDAVSDTVRPDVAVSDTVRGDSKAV